jgi:catechol 2,3-dioxygenase-like lactoylglutathione lyase family enzyme
MIAYITLGSNNLEKSAAFYDPIFAIAGAKRVYENERMISWGDGNGPSIMLMTPFDKQTATKGNGTMVALSVDSIDKVAEMHKLALELGAENEGDPGPRVPGMHFAYFRDPDGNKIAVSAKE